MPVRKNTIQTAIGNLLDISSYKISNHIWMIWIINVMHTFIYLLNNQCTFAILLGIYFLSGTQISQIVLNRMKAIFVSYLHTEFYSMDTLCSYKKLLFLIVKETISNHDFSVINETNSVYWKNVQKRLNEYGKLNIKL